MVRLALQTTVALLSLSPAVAAAGEAACIYERGVVIVPASVAGLAGDYILDTGAPATLLHETKAQMGGFAETDLHARVQVAGLVLSDRPIRVEDLDARTEAFPTPIAGVIGADLLSSYVVDVSFAPCRIFIRAPGDAPALSGRRLAMGAGAPAVSVRAGLFDGSRAFSGDLALATGGDAMVRLDARVARVADVADAAPYFGYGPPRARLSGLSLDGVYVREALAALAHDGDPQLLGSLGGPLLSRWRIRFDFPARQVVLARP